MNRRMRLAGIVFGSVASVVLLARVARGEAAATDTPTSTRTGTPTPTSTPTPSLTPTPTQALCCQYSGDKCVAENPGGTCKPLNGTPGVLVNNEICQDGRHCVPVPTPATPTANPTAAPTGSLEYSAKHWWLSAGAIILNPFSTSSCGGDNNACPQNPYMPPPPAMPTNGIPTPSDKRLKLDKGGQTTNAFIEGGYRHRWAWESDVAPPPRATPTGTFVTPTATPTPCWWLATNLYVRDHLDLEGRMGFVFGSSSTPSGAAAIVGGSDLYSEVTPGFRLWWAHLDDGVTRTRISLNLPEIRAAWSTDRAIDKVHESYLLGTALVIGGDWTQGADPYNPVELRFHAGAAHVEVPKFLSSDTRQIAIKNETIDFASDAWGFGVDVEANVPISRQLGYIMARGSFYTDFDPNPWSLQIGYTIPISTVLKAVAGAASQ
jgi:hypothetical protein